MPHHSGPSISVGTRSLDDLRAETPGLCAAGPTTVHLNAAGAGLIPKPVLNAVTEHLERESINGAYEAQAAAKPKLDAVYDSIALFLGVPPADRPAPDGGRTCVALVDNSTAAWDAMFYAVPFQPKDTIVTSNVEYGANYIAYLQLQKRKDLQIRVAPSAEDGSVDVEKLAVLLDELEAAKERVRLVSVTHIPTNGGLVNPVEEIGAVVAAFNTRRGFTVRDARERTLYLVDACQSAGQLPLDVERLRVDGLAAAGRKYLRGPRGIGFLYVRPAVLPVLEPAMLDHYAATWTGVNEFSIHPTARRFERWETSHALRLGLGVAVEYARQVGMEAIWARVQSLARHLRQRLAAVPGVTIHDLGTEDRQCGIVTFSLAGWGSTQLQEVLAQECRINTTVSSIHATRQDMEARGLTSLNRASVHYYNNLEELDTLCVALERISILPHHQ